MDMYNKWWHMAGFGWLQNSRQAAMWSSHWAMVHEKMCSNARHCNWCDARLVFSQKILCSWSQHHCTTILEAWSWSSVTSPSWTMALTLLCNDIEINCTINVLGEDKSGVTSGAMLCVATHNMCTHVLCKTDRHFAARLHQSSTPIVRQQ